MCVGFIANKDHQFTISESENELTISQFKMPDISIENHIMKYVIRNFILWLLLQKQKEHYAAVALDLVCYQ